MVEQECSNGWSNLPDHLKEETLSWLSLECLCRCRSVCKEWNALFTSTKFITSLWMKDYPRNKSSMLIFYNPDLRLPFPAYCFSTQTWKTCPSFSFLLDDEKPQNRGKSFHFYGSISGLFLVTFSRSIYLPTMAFRRSFHLAPKNIVCNPLTRRSFRLPAMSSITTILAQGIVQGAEGETYRVVAVGRSRGIRINGRGPIVEIYDSSEKSWRTAGHLQERLVVNQSVRNNHLVFSNDGFFYIETTYPRMGIVGFNMREGISTFAALPQLRYGQSVIWSKLFTCGSRILIAGIAVNRTIENVMTASEKVILWEFKKVNDGDSSWNEIARMPPHIQLEFVKFRHYRDEPFQCAGIGDFLYFRPYPTSKEVLIYDIGKGSWSRLPNCPFTGPFHCNMAFEPRPDMKPEGELTNPPPRRRPTKLSKYICIGSCSQ